MKGKQTIPIDELRHMFDYNPLTGALTWKNAFYPKKFPPGTPAGKLSKAGYIEVGARGMRFQAHRIAWAHAHGEWPRIGICHANGIGFDNRLENLRDAVPFSTQMDQDFYESRIERVPFSGCWLWMGNLNATGYGVFTRDYEQLGAHRASYSDHVGPIPDGMFVCHRCDVPCCVNPAHLFIGTHADNMRDMVQKGRHLRNRKRNANGNE